MKKIIFVTGTRSEYGLLSPLMKAMKADPNFDVQIAVTGSHLSPQFGMTYKSIQKDGFTIDKKIDILMSSDGSEAICKSMGLAMIGFGEYFKEARPDMIILLGDRYEAFAVAAAAAASNISIAHLHGGEITEGAYDEFFRHGITKMSRLHFTSCDEHRKRVIQLGEAPNTVFNVGAIGIENIVNLPLLSRAELEKSIEFRLDNHFALVTFHPVTLEKGMAGKQVQVLLDAISKISDMKFIITKANADDGGREINQILDKYASENQNKTIVCTSLGQIRYLSALKHCDFVLGNSSSGLIEAPSFNIPTVDIGNRQKGRYAGETVIHCETNIEEILNAISYARSTDFRNKIKSLNNPYGDGNVTPKIIPEIKNFLNSNAQSEPKHFYDWN